MKRSWIGLVLLLTLLGAGMLGTWAMEEIHEPIAQRLEEAADEVMHNRWANGAFLAASARKDWERWRLIRAAMADHNPCEDVDALFSVLEIYGAARQNAAFAALCREMALRVEAIGDAQGILPENLL